MAKKSKKPNVDGGSVDPTMLSTPVVLTVAEIAVLAKLLITTPLSGNQEQLVRILAIVKSIQAKLALAAQVIQKKLPTEKKP